MNRRCVAGALAFAACASVAAQAQALGDTLPPPPAGSKTIAGIVRDTLARPLDSVEVLIPSLRRKTTTGPDGSFRFNDVKPGTYGVGARKIGYYPQVRSVTIGDGGGVLTFAVVPLVRTLPPLVTTSTRGGLSGVVGDTAYNIITGAEVMVLASSRRAVTDSTGSFFLDLKPGRYMIRVRFEGFGQRLLSVNVPRDSGRQVLVWLAPSLLGATAREEAIVQAMGDRLMLRNPVYSSVLTREDINRKGWKELEQFVNSAAGRKVDTSCQALVDGINRQPIWSISAADVEGVEVYWRRPQQRVVVRSIQGAGGERVSSRPVEMPPMNDCPVTIFVWSRK